jgi:hypothetical protein
MIPLMPFERWSYGNLGIEEAWSFAVTSDRARHLLVLLLRFSGVILVLAFGAMLLPTRWMADTHAWLGMGAFPDTPLTSYLVRSVAALYGVHGVLVLIVAGDPVRYERIVLYLGVIDIVFGLMMLAIDLHARMPTVWTAIEGPSLVGAGVLVLYLRSRSQASRAELATTVR